MTDQEHPVESVEPTEGSVRMAPPPRVAVPAVAASTDPRAKRGNQRGPLYWTTVGVFVVLGLVAAAVFILLPDWVAQRPPASAAAEPALEPESPAVPTADSPSGLAADQTIQQRERIRSPEPASRRPAPQGGALPGEPAAVPEAPAVPSAPAVDPAKEAFGTAIAEGLAALEAGDLGAARSALEEARALRPDSRALADASRRLEAAEQTAAILGHRERGQAFEREESWGAALKEYEAVLALDGAIRFAQEGQARTSVRHDLDQRLQGHLARPGRLSDDAVLASAREALDDAGEIGSPGPRLQRQIEQLTGHVSIASTPIPVVLLSDEKTEVLVYRHGRLGAFKSKQLALRPGTYTVVGTRAGFRDVRHELEVDPESPPRPLTVKCVERI